MNPVDPKVVVVGEFSLVASELIDNLLKKNCQVVVVTRNAKMWRRKVGVELRESTNFSVKTKLFYKQRIDYLIYVFYPLKLQKGEIANLKRDLGRVRKIAKHFRPKTLLVFPYVGSKDFVAFVDELIKKIEKKRHSFWGFLFLGDIVTLEKSNWKYLNFNRFIKERMRFKKTDVLRSKYGFWLVEIKRVVEEITKSLFSLSAYGNKRAIISKPILLGDLVRLINRRDYLVGRVGGSSGLDKFDLNEDEKVFLGVSSRRLARKLVRKYFQKRSVSGGSDFRKNGRRFWRRKSRFVLAAVTLGLISPFIFCLGSFAFSFVARKSFDLQNYGLTKSMTKISYNLASVSRKMTTPLTKVPMLGYVYSYNFQVVGILEKTSDLFLESYEFKKNTFDLYRGVVGGDDLSSVDYDERVLFDLDLIYQKTNFLGTEIEDARPGIKKMLRSIVGSRNLGFIKERIVLLRSLAEEMSLVIGREGQVTYLFLLQDSSVLRSTGGIVDSLVIATLTDGELGDMQVIKVSSADKALAGDVVPPWAIEKYLGLRSWYLRDSNWSSDFPSAAAKAEWFLNKELNIEVDGVVALNVDFFSDFLEEFGEIRLEEKGGVLSLESISEIVGGSYEDEDYPFGERAGGYLDMIESFLARTADFNEIEGVDFVSFVTEELVDKNIQVYLHNSDAQEALAGLAWDGGIRVGDCGERCYPEVLGVIESNFGDAISKEIDRESQFSVSFEENLLKRRLTLFMSNPTNKTYKAYMRVLINADSGFGETEIYAGDDKEKVKTEVSGAKGYKEGGVYVEIEPGKAKAIVFSWEGGTNWRLSEDGKYVINVRKQPGVDEIPLLIRVDIPSRGRVEVDEIFSLTKNGQFEYNTTLDSDLVLPVF